MSYLIPAGATPEQVQRQQELARLLMWRGSQPREIRHWTQGAAQLADALMGGLNMRAANKQESEGRASAADQYPHDLVEAMFKRSSAAPASPTTATASASPASAPPVDTLAAGTTPTFDGTKMLRADYAGPAWYPPAAEREKTWRSLAAAKGLNPDEVVKLLKGENLNDSGDIQSNFRNKAGVREPSFGDSQLLVGGPGTGFGPGLGNEALEQGIDPRNPNQWMRAADFATDKMAQGGVGPWMAAPKVGVTNASIRAPQQVASADQWKPMMVGSTEGVPAASGGSMPPPTDIMPPAQAGASIQTAQADLPWLRGDQPQPQQGGGMDTDVSAIISALRNPWTPPEDRALLLKVLESRMPKSGWEKFGKDDQAYDHETRQWITPPRVVEETVKPHSELGKITADERAGFIPPEEAAAARGRRAGTALTPDDKKAIREADEFVRSADAALAVFDEAVVLSKKAGKTGAWGSAINTLGAYGGNEASKAALDLNNLIKTNALEQLKATFGGMPTEGERKILIEVQGSADQPPEVREAIYARAKTALANRRRYNKEMADSLRSGTYYGPRGTSEPGDPPPGVTQEEWDVMDPEERAAWN